MSQLVDTALGGVSLQPARPADEPFLLEVYSSTRTGELAHVGWTEQQRSTFLRMQFRAQDKHYRENYPGAEFHIIQVDGEAAGRLYVHRRPKEIRVMDIALLPAFRGRGIGTRLLKEVLAEGERSGRSVTIHVELFNPALRLYRRLGFTRVTEHGPYLRMEWSPLKRLIPDSLLTLAAKGT